MDRVQSSDGLARDIALLQRHRLLSGRDELVYDLMKTRSAVFTDPNEAKAAAEQDHELIQQQAATSAAVGCVVTESTRDANGCR